MSQIFIKKHLLSDWHCTTFRTNRQYTKSIVISINLESFIAVMQPIVTIYETNGKYQISFYGRLQILQKIFDELKLNFQELQETQKVVDNFLIAQIDRINKLNIFE